MAFSFWYKESHTCKSDLSDMSDLLSEERRMVIRKWYLLTCSFGAFEQSPKLIPIQEPIPILELILIPEPIPVPITEPILIPGHIPESILESIPETDAGPTIRNRFQKSSELAGIDSD